MRRHDPWEIYQQENLRRRWIKIPVVQAIIAGCLLSGVWILSATNTELGKKSGQLVWQATCMMGDFSPIRAYMESFQQSLVRLPWIDSVRAVTARQVNPFHYLEQPIEGTLVTPFGMGKDGRFHEEVEWEVKFASTVKATSAGKVIDVVRDDAGGGRTLVVQSGPMTVRYGYLSETWVTIGDLVARGQGIGRSGKKDGKVPMMSLSIRERGQAIDPLPRMSNGSDRGRGQ